MKKGFEYQYFLKDHLGSTRVVLSQTGKTLQQTGYYPFGMLMAGLPGQKENNDNKYLYTGKELQDDFELGWYDYGKRFYDAQLGLWHVVDPMAHEREWLSTYNYVQNNPLKRIDPNGALDDGYKDMQGNYKWFDGETANIIEMDDKLWIKYTDNKDIFNMAVAGILDNVPEPTDPGKITRADNLTTFEMWLDSPSESVAEGIGKMGLNLAYSFVNSPTVLLTGKSLGGTQATPKDKMAAFIDVAPSLISFGLTATKEVVNLSKVSNKGFSRYNKFVEKASDVTTTKGLSKGTKWQKRASNCIKLI